MSKLIKTLKKHHFTPEELISFLRTVGSVFAVDGVLEIQKVLSGDFSRPALLALLVAIVRSGWKAYKLLKNTPNIQVAPIQEDLTNAP